MNMVFFVGVWSLWCFPFKALQSYSLLAGDLTAQEDGGRMLLEC